MLLNLKTIKKVIKNPFIVFKYFKKECTIYKDKIQILSNFFNKNEFRKFKKELYESGLIDELKSKEEWFYKNVEGKTGRGNLYGFGSMKYEEMEVIYALIRKRKPEILVETGVCNGVSSAIILYALYINEKGKLYSIDLPEFTEKKYDTNYFWEGKKGAAVPMGKESGWIIPEYLRLNWKLIIGRSQEKLPSLLKQLKSIDLFFHDSEHSFDCMWFEFNEVIKSLKKGGIIIADDINWNDAFVKFAEKYKKHAYNYKAKVGIMEI